MLSILFKQIFLEYLPKLREEEFRILTDPPSSML